jgi:hypothetical protein
MSFVKQKLQIMKSLYIFWKIAFLEKKSRKLLFPLQKMWTVNILDVPRNKKQK